MYTVIKIILILIISSSIAYSLQEGSICKTKNDENGVCKRYSDCPLILNKLRNREIGRSDVIDCNAYGVICCPIEIARIKGEISKRKCKEIESLTQTHIRVGVSILNPNGTLLTASRCKHKSVSLIVGGEEAYRYEFPHQTLLGYMTGKGIQWACGGSLISSKYVLTAAHCNYRRSLREIKFVKLGMLDRSQDDNDVFIYNVINKIIHPQYDRISFNNDIALLELDKDVKFSEYIYPICLPTRQHDEEKAIVTGLGTTGKDHAQSEKLLKVVLEKFSHRECQEKVPQPIDKASMLCYGDNSDSKDACRGDSGGPIQVPNDDESHCTYKIIGVVSFGALNCGTPGIPSIFVNVYNYLSWIEDIIWKDEK
ncbi:hypothetical protein ACKWTF_001045 [Chironomus riparius]